MVHRMFRQDSRQGAVDLQGIARMPDVFTRRKRSEVMSRIRSRGNKDTEIALAKLLRANHITGWRRQVRLVVRSQEPSTAALRAMVDKAGRRGKRRRPKTEALRQVREGLATPVGAQGDRERRGATVRVDFLFPKQRVAVFVDGCFWHGCPKHSSPARWLTKSSMKHSPLRGLRVSVVKKESPRTGKAFWASKMASNMARDRFVNRTLRKNGWKVVRIWEHDLTPGRSQKSEFRRQQIIDRIRRLRRFGVR